MNFIQYAPCFQTIIHIKSLNLMPNAMDGEIIKLLQYLVGYGPGIS